MYNFQCSNCLKPIPSISQQILDMDRHLILVSEMLWRERLANNFSMQQTQTYDNQIKTTSQNPCQNIPIVPDQNIDHDFQKYKKFKTIQQDQVESSRNQFQAISVSSSNKEQSLEKIRQIQQQILPVAPQQSVINPYITLFFQDTNTINPNIHPNNQTIQDNNPVQKTNQIYCPICLKQFNSSCSKNRHIRTMHQFQNGSGTQNVSNYQEYLNLNKDTINDNRASNFQNNQNNQNNTDIDIQDNRKNDFNPYTYYKNYSHSLDQYLDNTQNNNNNNNNNKKNTNDANNDWNNNQRNNKNNINDKNNRNNTKLNSSNLHQKQNKQSSTKFSNHSAISESILAQCPVCYKLFSHKSSKDKHLKKAHNIQNSQYIPPTNKDYLDQINQNKQKSQDNVPNSLKLMLRNSDQNKNNNNHNNNNDNINNNNINKINHIKTNQFDVNLRSNGSSISRLPNSNIQAEIDKKQCPICLKIFSIASSKDRHLKEVHKIQNNISALSSQIPKAFQEFVYQKKDKNKNKDKDKSINPIQNISKNADADLDIEIDIQVENEQQNINPQSPQMGQTNNQDKNNENIIENSQENNNLDNSLVNNNFYNKLNNTQENNILENIEDNNNEQNESLQNNLVHVYNTNLENTNSGNLNEDKNSQDNNDRIINNNTNNNLENISNNMNENQQIQQKLDYVYNDDDNNDNDDGDSYLNQELICQICQKQFKSNAAVMRHFLILHSKSQQDEDLICLDCDIRFENDEWKQFHLKHVHRD